MLVPRPALEATLPLVTSLSDCADYSKTVEPYLPQLYDLPQKIFDNIGDLQALRSLYIATNPFVTALAFALFLSGLVLVVSEANKNYSQVDRLWSILPAVYNCHYDLWAHLNGLPAHKVDHVMAVSVIWSMRLTFNYWRKGGYSIGSEDYRWAIIKDKVGPVPMFIFNIVFISLIQNLLLFFITAPTYVLLLASRIDGHEMTVYDTWFSRGMFCLVLIEFFADQQQWNFHQAKAEYQRTAKVPQGSTFTREQLDRGFLTSGLWKFSRHPNFAAEQGFWVFLYQWACCESYTIMNYTFIGALCYLFLFQGSTWLTELLSSRKYPEYKIYQERVSKFLPKANTKSMDEKEKVPTKQHRNAEKPKGAGKSKKK